MRRYFALALLGLLLLAPATVQGQTAVAANRLGWDQSAATLAEASTYTYRYYADGAAAPVTLSSVVCTGLASPFQCTAPFPAFTPGNHSLILTALNAAGESSKIACATGAPVGSCAVPLAFTFVVVPAVPSNLSIK